jgi:hypothetical protein
VRPGFVPAFLLAIALTFLAGCGGGEGRVDAGAEASAAVCGTADLAALKAVVYVSPQGNDAAGCGKTTGAACASIQQGIAQCAASGCGVLVRHGLYATSATISLRDAVPVYGSCRFDGEADHHYRSVIDAAPAPGTPAVSAVGIDTPTTLYGIVVAGKQETAAGTASIALAASNSKALTLSASVLVAGKGGDGAPGAQEAPASAGGDAVAPTSAFVAGAGGAACSGSNAGAGGRGAAINLLYTVHHAGFEWTACSNANLAGTGPNGETGSDAGGVKGGSGGTPGTAGCYCDTQVQAQAGNAPQAAQGNEGACAATGGGADLGAVWGRLNGVVWTPGQGATGGVGSGGSGGGGGGGGGYSADSTYNSGDINGYAGGGGGGGGCGGGGGSGGQQGGASLALVLATSTLVNDGSSIIPGPGGTGGNGATGGEGGSGGFGKPGWPGGDQVQQSCTMENGNPYPAPGSGGSGGNGGQGGAGGGGAAGNGGPSIGIALVSGSTAPVATGGIYAPLPGPAGIFGNGGQNPISAGNPQPCMAAAGGAGVEGGGRSVVNFDQPLSSTLMPGQQLAKGQRIMAPNGQVLLTMQTDDNFCLYPKAGELAAWCSSTVGQSIPAAIMQTDGNLCLYPADSAKYPPWCTSTPGNPGAYLAVRDDVHVQIIDGASVLWSRP